MGGLGLPRSGGPGQPWLALACDGQGQPEDKRAGDGNHKSASAPAQASHSRYSCTASRLVQATLHAGPGFMGLVALPAAQGPYWKLVEMALEGSHVLAARASWARKSRQSSLVAQAKAVMADELHGPVSRNGRPIDRPLPGPAFLAAKCKPWPAVAGKPQRFQGQAMQP